MIIYKTPAEIEKMRRAGQVLFEAMKAVKAAVRPGVTTAELDRIAEEAIRARGGVPSEKGYEGFPGSICASPDDMVVHGIPSEKTVLREGQIISIDCTVLLDGYQADMARTFPVGKISPEAQSLIDAAKESFGEGLKMARSGNRIGDISAAIQACVETLCTRYGAPLLQPGGNVLYAFPTAQALAAAGEQALRDCALGYRAPYVLAAAQAVAAGALDLAALETLPDARLLEALMQQHGVGIKVANCVALFAYGRMECAPVDVWIQRVIDQHYAGQNPFPAYGNAGILQQWMFYFARSEKERVK